MGFNDINLQVSGPQQPASTYKTKVLKGQVPFATQVTEPNTKYVIKHNFVLNGDVTIPENCILEFDGGSLSNGEIIGNNTSIIAPYTKIFSNISFVNFGIPFNARWFVSKVNKTVIDSDLYDCYSELQYAFTSGISNIHFTNDVYYISDTINVPYSVHITGDMLDTDNFTAWNDGQRQWILSRDKFKGIFTNTGKTILYVGNTGEIDYNTISIEGVNFITDYYYFDDTYDNSIPVIKIKGHYTWGLNFDARIVSMTNSGTPRGIGMLLTTHDNGYIADCKINGRISGFDKCIVIDKVDGWINGVEINASLSGYQGCISNAGDISAYGLFQTQGNKEGNNDAFFDITNGPFVLGSMVYDYNSEGRVKYAVKYPDGNSFKDLMTPYTNRKYHNIGNGIGKDYNKNDWFFNSVLRPYISDCVITSRLYNSVTDEDIDYTLNNIDEFFTLDNDVLEEGANISMNNGSDFSSDIIDNIAFTLTIETPQNIELFPRYISYFVYMFGVGGSYYQGFKKLSYSVQIKNGRTLLEKNDISLLNPDGFGSNLIQDLINLENTSLVITLTWSQLTNTKPSVYLGSVGFCNMVGNNRHITNSTIYKKLYVTELVPNRKQDNSILYSSKFTNINSSVNYGSFYIGTVTFKNLNTADDIILKGFVNRWSINDCSDITINITKSAGNSLVFKTKCALKSTSNNNMPKLYYKATNNGTTLAIDLFMSFSGPSSGIVIKILQALQGLSNTADFKLLYPYNTALPGDATVASYLGVVVDNSIRQALTASDISNVGAYIYDAPNKRNLKYYGDTFGWIDLASGTKESVKRSGTKAQRPVGNDIYVGFMYMQVDTTNGTYPIWASAISGDTVTWVDATGTPV